MASEDYEYENDKEEKMQADFGGIQEKESDVEDKIDVTREKNTIGLEDEKKTSIEERETRLREIIRWWEEEMKEKIKETRESYETQWHERNNGR